MAPYEVALEYGRDPATAAYVRRTTNTVVVPPVDPPPVVVDPPPVTPGTGTQGPFVTSWRPGQPWPGTVRPNTTEPRDAEGRLIGDKYVRYEDLKQPGDTRITQTLQRCPAGKIVTFGPGIYYTSDFLKDNFHDYASINPPKWCGGIAGVGSGNFWDDGSKATVFRMVPMSSSAAGAVPDQSTGGSGGTEGSTNQCRVLKSGSPNQAVRYEGFRVEGTDQGHNYHVMNIPDVPYGSVIRDVKTSGGQGDNSANPGETFGLIVGQDKRGKYGTNVDTDPSLIVEYCFFDGRQQNNGKSYVPVGLSVQGSFRAKVRYCGSRFVQTNTFVGYRSFRLVTEECDWDGRYNPNGYFTPVFATKAQGAVNWERCGSKAEPVEVRRCLLKAHGSNQTAVNIVHITFSVDSVVTQFGTATAAPYSGSCVNGHLKVVSRADGGWAPPISATNPRARIQSWGGAGDTGGYGAGSTLTKDNPPTWVKNDGVTPESYQWVYGQSSAGSPPMTIN